MQEDLRHFLRSKTGTFVNFRHCRGGRSGIDRLHGQWKELRTASVSPVGPRRAARWRNLLALIALGFVAIFNVTGIINLAQGGFVMLGAMFCVQFYNMPFCAEMAPALRLALAGVLSVVIVGLIGALMERLAIAPARNSPQLTLIIITVGVYTIMWGAALLLWGPEGYQLPAFSTLDSRDQIMRFGQIIQNDQTYWIFGDATLPKRAQFVGVMIKAQSFWIWGNYADRTAWIGLLFRADRAREGIPAPAP